MDFKNKLNPKGSDRLIGLTSQVPMFDGQILGSDISWVVSNQTDETGLRYGRLTNLHTNLFRYFHLDFNIITYLYHRRSLFEFLIFHL